MPDDPKRKLTEFLADADKGNIDAKTDLPTAAVVQAQLYHRLMAELGVSPAAKFADMFGTVMLSFDRRSRKEAVLAITGRLEEKPPPEVLSAPREEDEG